MKTNTKKIIICLTIISTIGFTSCNQSEENLEQALSLEAKIELLEKSEWLVKDFEDRVMHTFAKGERFTYYGSDNEFSDEALPGTQAYKVSGNVLEMDFNFGNIFIYELVFSCDNTIVEFYRDGELNTTLYKRNSNYKKCL